MKDETLISQLKELKKTVSLEQKWRQNAGKELVNYAKTTKPLPARNFPFLQKTMISRLPHLVAIVAVLGGLALLLTRVTGLSNTRSNNYQIQLIPSPTNTPTPTVTPKPSVTGIVKRPSITPIPTGKKEEDQEEDRQKKDNKGNHYGQYK